MPPTNPRKRAAPGASPAVQAPPMQQRNYNAPAPLSNADFLQWNQASDAQTYADPSAAYNLHSGYGENTLSQAPFEQPLQAAHSTQLTRRPHNRQMVATGQRPAYDNSADPWGQFGDDSMLEPQNGNGSGSGRENDNIELLEEKAVVAKRDAQAKRKQIPPFVQKLSSFLDESKNTELIRWSDRGDSFVVLDEDEFAKTLIPELFKHNNYASFVRQLNMYGFHKRVGLSDNSMKASERKNKSPSEYYNPYFKRGHPNLLWLINKPKGGANLARQSKKGRVKNEDQNEGDSEEDIREAVDESYGPSVNYNMQTRAVSVAPESGALQKRDMALVHGQLTDIQKQQAIMASAISRLNKNHQQLYQQAMAFQSLHDRHENSISAILTFLATVYNRTLDDSGAENLSRLFGNSVIPQDSQHQQQGNVVDIGDVGNQSQTTPGSPSPHRKQQRLLMAPPRTGRSKTASPMPPQSQYGTPRSERSGTIEEVFDHNSPVESTQPVSEPQQGMMNLINNTNAANTPDNNAMQFPDVLLHYENASGNSPLTSEQRSNMLSMMASSSPTPVSANNALVTPTPPIAQNIADIARAQSEIDELMRFQHSQDARIQNLAGTLGAADLPALNDNPFVNSNFEGSDPDGNNIDMDQFLNTESWGNANSPPGASFDLDNFGTPAYDAHSFGMSTDGAADVFRGDAGLREDRITETRASSESLGGEDVKTGILTEGEDENGLGRRESKRRRKV